MCVKTSEQQRKYIFVHKHIYSHMYIYIYNGEITVLSNASDEFKSAWGPALEYIQSQNYHFCTCVFSLWFFYKCIYRCIFWTTYLETGELVLHHLDNSTNKLRSNNRSGITLFFADILGSALADVKRHITVYLFFLFIALT